MTVRKKAQTDAILKLQHLQISNRNQNKQSSISNTTICIDKLKKTIYFDRKWSLKFIHISNLEHLKLKFNEILDSCQEMLDSLEEVEYQAEDQQLQPQQERYQEEEEMTLQFFGIKGEEYTCTFLVSNISLKNNSRLDRHRFGRLNNTNASIVSCQELIQFIHFFQKVFDKWEFKQQKKFTLQQDQGYMDDDDDDYQRLDSFGRIRKSKSLSPSTTSSHLTSSTGYNTGISSFSSTTPMKRKKTYGRNTSKLQRRLHQMIMNDNHVIDRDGDDIKEDKHPSTIDDVCSLNNEEDEMNGQDDATGKGSTKKRKDASNGDLKVVKRRLMKKVRPSDSHLQDEDSDDDFSFHNATQNNDNHDPMMTDLTELETRVATVVSPTHINTSNDSMDNKKDSERSLKETMNREEFDEAVTDIEEDNQSISHAEEKKDKGPGKSNTLHSFFQAKDVVANSIDMNGNMSSVSGNNEGFTNSSDERSKADKNDNKEQTDLSPMKRNITTSKYFSKTSIRSSADEALERRSRMSPPVQQIKSSPRSNVTKTSPLKQPIQTNAIINPYKTNIKPQSTHVGLKNLGNTCYLNSSLQMIFSVPDFLRKVQEFYETCGNEKEMPLTISLLRVACDAKIISSSQGLMSTSTLRSVDPRGVKEAIDVLTDKFMGYEQRDAHEFASALIDYVHDELTNVTKGNEKQTATLPTDEYFKLDVKVCLTCDACNYTRSKEEMYRHISIDIGEDKEADSTWSLDESLNQFFSPEVRELRCEKCESGTTATQTLQVMSRPRALLLHLKRFILNEEASSFRKNKARVRFTKSLSLEKYREKDDKELLDEYNLSGIVCHLGGTAFSGHYTANCMRMKTLLSNDEKEAEWVSFDDGASFLSSSQNIFESEKNQRTAYMLLYSY